MKASDFGILGIIVFIATLLAQVSAIFLTMSKPNNLGKFNLKEDMIAKDLDGRIIPLAGGQVWPLDLSQNIRVKMESKKSLDEYVIVIVDVSAVAPVSQEQGTKEQFSTTPNSKDAPKSQKMPTKLQLKGIMKLTYELVEGNWYLITADGLNMRAFPLD